MIPVVFHKSDSSGDQHPCFVWIEFYSGRACCVSHGVMRGAPFSRLGLPRLRSAQVATFSPPLRCGENVAYAGNVVRNY